jgi:hypothetical protein
MARLFGRLFGSGSQRAVAQARAAEVRGELAQAATLYAQGGRLDEAARVMLLRGDAESDPAARLRHYTQAAAAAPAASTVKGEARRKRAMLVVTMARDAPMTATLRQDVLDAARDLEEIGDQERAAEAYAQVGDVEGEARALARAGDVDKLDALLDVQQGRDREAISRRAAHDEFGVLLASGRRRDAAAIARASGDDALRERGRLLEARRVTGVVVRVRLRGVAVAIALGDEIVIGRAPDPSGDARIGTIAIASAAVSRRHVAISRQAGRAVVRDLGSRNGTTLRGLALAGEVGVGDGEGVELKLGREVPLVVRPATEMPDAVSIEIAGARYVASLGPTRLGIGNWRLERGDDGWVELVTDDDPPAFAGALRLAERVSLLATDVVARARAGEPAFAIEV